MRDFLLRFRKQIVYPIAITAILAQTTPIATYAVDASLDISASSDAAKDGYEINFNNVSILEYIRFVSKILNVNFVFNDADLQFNVTIVSSEPISPKNIFSALVQVLRINNIAILEQGNNYLLTASNAINQIPPVVSDETPSAIPPGAPVITRIFRIKNANVTTLAGILRPMMSKAALIEISPETRQLIVTDITTNVEQIATLLLSLDSPSNPLDVGSYTAKSITPAELITLSLAIITPFAEGNKLIFVPQVDTNTIFIVSTPYLIDRAINLLQELDVPVAKAALGRPIANENIFLYKIQQRPATDLVSALKEISMQLQSTGAPPSKLVTALDNVKWVKESNSLLFIADGDTLTKIKDILPDLDTSVQGPNKTNFYIYKIQNASQDQIKSSLNQISDNLQASPVPDKNLIDAIQSMKWIKESNSLVFTGDDQSLKRLGELLPSFDSPSSVPKKSTFYIYKIQHATKDQIEASLDQLVDNLKSAPVPDTGLIDAINSEKWIKESNSLTFTGDEKALKLLTELLPTFDQASAAPKSTFYIYTIQNANEEQIEGSLKQIIDNLKKSGVPDEDFINALDSIKWIKETNSLVFTGNAEALKRVQQLLPTLDVNPEQSKMALTQPAASTQFLSYKPEFRTGDEIQASLQEMGKNLKDSGLANPSFLHAIDTMKWVPSTKTLLFTGDPASLERIQAVLKTTDIPSGSIKKTEIFIYKPKFASKDQLQNGLNHLASTLDLKNPADRNLSNALKTMTWMSDSGTFVFQADAETIDRIKSLVASMDSTQGLASAPQNFYLYPLKNARGDTVLSSLHQVVSHLKGANLTSPSLINTINGIKWVEPNNSLMITGPETDIDQVKDLIARLDVEGPIKVQPPATPGKSSFYIYKPLHRSAKDIEDSLTDIAKDLETSGLIDQELLDTISTMRFVPSTESLLFTGTPSALEKVKSLLDTVDVSGGVTQVQKVAGVTFLIYKIKNASSTQLMSSLKTVAGNLETANSLDKDLAQAISGMKYIPDTNSILFTGPASGLEKAETLAQKFDTPELKAPELAPLRETAPSTFVIYQPQYKTGDELISMLCGFEQNLIQSGVSNKGLFDTINNLKWMPETCSLLISGDEPSIAKVQELLLKFDVPLPNAAAGPLIEAIENTSFLVYKLQYQQGEEIKKALTQIGSEFTAAHSSANQALYDAINSVQWITVTNSLLASGDQTVLVKLQDLIQNLDVPLRQVFIEVLIIQTTLANAQDIGLQWGGRLQLFNKVAAGTGLAPQQNPQSSQPPFNNFSTNFPNINATNTPTPSATNIPLIGGFDFGVIGDIIMNKGKSFLSLGSLVNALQTDNDTVVVMNPKIIAQDNNLSTIFVGQNLPFTSSTISNTGGGSTTANTQNIEYRDIGVNLSITPTLGNGDIITLDISNDITNTIQSAVQGISTTGIPTSHTNMSTRVHVPNKHFVALSGMIQDTKSHFRSQIPCLGGLPVIGLIFSEVERDDLKSNIIIFVRPQIINSFDEYKQITERQQNLYKDVMVLPVVKEEFDDGIDWVKTPEDE